MSGRVLSMLLALGLAPCASGPSSGDSQPVEAQRTDETASTSTAGSCPAPGTRCDDYGATCEAGRSHCHCTSPCSGMELPPEQSYSRWACVERDPACPDAIPESGQACRPNGLRCGWGTCGGASAICEDKRWTVHHYGPPP